MDSIFKTLKDTKRRVLQASVAAVDPSLKTVDHEYDIHVAKFPEMIRDMNECGASLNSSLVHQKKMFADSAELANSLARIYHNNVTESEWVNTECHLKEYPAAQAYKQCWDKIHNTYRSSSAMVSAELSLEPLRAAVTRMQPEIEAQCKQRNIKLTDYDSYRRRVKQLDNTQEKQSAKMIAPGATPADAKALEATISEIARFQAKLQVAEASFHEENDRIKDDIIKAKFAHDQIMDMFMITTIVAQADLFSRAAAELNAIVDTLPVDRVDQVRRRIEIYIAQGGIQVGKPNEAITGAAALVNQSTAGKGVAILTGKATYSDLQKVKEEKNAMLDKENAERLKMEQLVLAEQAAINNSDAHPVPSAPPPPPIEENAPRPLPTVPTAVLISSTGVVPSTENQSSTPRPISINATATARPSNKKVIALFDHEADADDELTFLLNDVIEVIDDTDEGWWYGRNIKTSCVGLFPANYVKRV